LRSIKRHAAPRTRSERKSCGRSNGMRGDAPDPMAARSKRPSEAWTIPLHVIMWTAITVGFIMTLVVLVMRK